MRRWELQILRQAALQEFRTGTPERGRSIFEQLLRDYPKRLDLWSVYLDQVSVYHTWPQSDS